VHMLSRPKELSTARSCGTREISFDKIFFWTEFHDNPSKRRHEYATLVHICSPGIALQVHRRQ